MRYDLTSLAMPLVMIGILTVPGWPQSVSSLPVLIATGAKASARLRKRGAWT